MDSSLAQGKKAVHIVELGSDKMPPGVDAALRTMTKGMKAHLVVPPEYAYPDAHPNEAATCTVELVRFSKPTHMCTQCSIC